MQTLVRDPLFRAVVSSRVEAGDVERLFAGTLAAVHLEGLIPSEVCRQVIGSLDSVPLERYDEQRVDPPIARFGPTIDSFNRSGQLQDSYLPAVELAQERWRSAAFVPDPVAMCRDAIAESWLSDVRVATVDGRRAFAGTIREINRGALVHYDELERDFPDGVFDDRLVGQLAFNAYLSVPETGGETIVWRRRWRPEDEACRKGYGFDSSVVEGSESVEVSFAAGDGVLFDPRNYHAVNPGFGNRRITVSFFVGLTARGDLILWS